MADEAANEREQAPALNPYAAKHGDYVPAAQIGAMRKTMKNQGGTTLDRWRRDGLITEHQDAAILHIQRLWRLTETNARLVANLDRTVFGAPGDGNMAEIDARFELHRIRSGFHNSWWDIFENVCRFDESAGVAGSAIARTSRSSAEAARLVVCMVADTIYTRERLSY